MYIHIFMPCGFQAGITGKQKHVPGGRKIRAISGLGSTFY